jgi:N-acetylglucosaminyldiphosphoundecaprenol N-acetyl-beta-D-mannosaminyltransferase
MLFGMSMDVATLGEAIVRCEAAVTNRTTLNIGVLNAAKVVNLRKDPELRAALVDCDMRLADGQSVVWASRLLRKPLPERVAGIDLFDALLEVAARDGRSVYLLGAREEVLVVLQTRILERHPGLKIAGARNGYFGPAEEEDIVEVIRASGADMLFLGMTSPKKEIFIRDRGQALGVPLLHGVGGSFDVLAGLTRRAPERWQRLGLEWLYRLRQEPRRLFRRYLVTNTAFLCLCVLELMRPAAPYRGRTVAGPSEPTELPVRGRP